jgi:hypothetical protein
MCFHLFTLLGLLHGSALFIVSQGNTILFIVPLLGISPELKFLLHLCNNKRLLDGRVDFFPC